MNQLLNGKESNIFTVASDYENSLEVIGQDCRLSNMKVEVYVVSVDKETDSDALIAAVNHSIVCRCQLSCGREFIFDSKDRLGLAVRLMKYLNSEGGDQRFKYYVLKYVSDIFVKNWKTKIFDSDLKKLDFLTEDQFSYIEACISRRESDIKGFHSVTFDSVAVENYLGMSDFILGSNDKLIILNGDMGTFKTTCQSEVYSKAKSKGDFPMFITGKRTIADAFSKNHVEDHYRLEGSEKNKSGLVGVVNSLVQRKYLNVRENVKIVLIDEIEDMFFHVADGPLGARFEDRLFALDRLAELLASADKVIVADATITNQTIHWLRGVVNAEPVIYTARSDKDLGLGMRVVTENELLGMVKGDISNGKKVALFSDSRKAVFREILEGFQKISGCSVRAFTQKTFSDGEWTLESLNERLLESDVALISPVINAGVSIALQEYDRVYLLAGGTLHPTSLLQSLRRFRCSRQAIVAFRQGVGKRPILCKEKYVLDRLGRDVRDPFGTMQQLLGTESGKFLAEYAVNRSYQFKGFRQVLLIAAEQLGFNVEHDLLDGKVKKTGGEVKRLGKKKIAEDQRKIAFESASMWANGALGTSKIEIISKDAFHQEVADRTVGALRALGELHLTDDLYEQIFFYNLDRLVLNRRRLNRGSIASPDNVTGREKLASRYTKALLEFAGVNFLEPEASHITPSSAKDAVSLLSNVVKVDGGGKMPLLSLFELIFPSVNVGFKHNTPVIRQCVEALGLKLVESARSNGVRIYGITDCVVSSSTGIQYNMTEIASSYEGLPSPEALPFDEHIRQISNDCVADLWGAW